MTRAELTDLLGRLEYRDWSFQIVAGGERAWTVKIGPPDYIVDQAYPERDWPQKFFEMVYIDRTMDDIAVVSMIRAHIAALADHEVFEWFKLDGRAAIDPHHGPMYAKYGYRKEWFLRAEGRGYGG